MALKSLAERWWLTVQANFDEQGNPGYFHQEQHPDWGTALSAAIRFVGPGQIVSMLREEKVATWEGATGLVRTFIWPISGWLVSRDGGDFEPGLMPLAATRPRKQFDPAYPDGAPDTEAT